jgi:hypothetical protein
MHDDALAEKMSIPAASSVPKMGGGGHTRERKDGVPWITIGGLSNRSRSRLKKKQN